MATTYEVAGKDVRDLIARVVKEHHKELNGVTIDALIVTRMGKRTGHEVALKNHGYPVAAKIQITSLADRARKVADAKLTIDSFAWGRLANGSKEALIDHELQHLAKRWTKKSNGIDDLGRPLLKTRPHDWEMTGFQVIAERHGEAAIEVQQIVNFRANYGDQLKLWK